MLPGGRAGVLYTSSESDTIQAQHHSRQHHIISRLPMGNWRSVLTIDPTAWSFFQRWPTRGSYIRCILNLNRYFVLLFVFFLIDFTQKIIPMRLLIKSFLLSDNQSCLPPHPFCKVLCEVPSRYQVRRQVAAFDHQVQFAPSPDL